MLAKWSHGKTSEVNWIQGTAGQLNSSQFEWSPGASDVNRMDVHCCTRLLKRLPWTLDGVLCPRLLICLIVCKTLCLHDMEGQIKWSEVGPRWSPDERMYIVVQGTSPECRPNEVTARQVKSIGFKVKQVNWIQVNSSEVLVQVKSRRMDVHWCTLLLKWMAWTLDGVLCPRLEISLYVCKSLCLHDMEGQIQWSEVGPRWSQDEWMYNSR